MPATSTTKRISESEVMKPLSPCFGKEKLAYGSKGFDIRCEMAMVMSKLILPNDVMLGGDLKARFHLEQGPK